MSYYVILTRDDNTVCLEEGAKHIVRRYLKNGYHIIGRVKCYRRTIAIGVG